MCQCLWMPLVLQARLEKEKVEAQLAGGAEGMGMRCQGRGGRGLRVKRRRVRARGATRDELCLC